MRATIIALFFLSFVAVCIGILFIVNSRRTRSKNAQGLIESTTSTHRIAVFIPFLADGPESIPPYLHLFVTSAAGSSSLVDFFIFHNGVLDNFYYDNLPTNVKIISMGSTEGMITKFLQVLDERRNEDFKLESRDLLVKILSRNLAHYPYVLIEFKPALGHIFSSYLAGYTHWAYTDLDIVFGDLTHWITKDELEDFDIVTYGFGDSDRAYLRGQFTMHRNDATKINQLWRDCEYLSKMDERFADILSGVSKIQLESAEACYSVKVLKRNDIKVKFAVKAFTDVNKEDSAYTHGVNIGLGTKRDKSVLYKAETGHGNAMIALSSDWFERPDYDGMIQVERGQKESVHWRNDPTINCMYWVRDIYRSALCILGAEKTNTLFLENGHLLKQTYENMNLPKHVLSAAFFHFQEWKRSFRYNQNAAFNRESMSSWILTQHGVLPLPAGGKGKMESVRSPLGIPPPKWKGARDQLPAHPYCICTGQRQSQSSAATCKLMISWRNSLQVEVLAWAEAWRQVNVSGDVTLALTLQVTAVQAKQALDAIVDVAIANVNAWQRQPCVLVVHIAGATELIAQRAREKLRSISHKGLLIALIANDRPDPVSRKALMNMAVDAAPTRWVVSGIELERGLIISKEASIFCSRRAKIHGNHRSQVLIIPQFAIEDAEDLESISIRDLLDLKAKSPSRVQEPADFEEESCEDEKDVGSNDIFSSIDELWWKFSSMEVQGNSLLDELQLINEYSAVLDEFEASVLNIMTDGEGLEILDNSPVLMFDNMGPHNGVYTSTFVREIEEFGGKHCYNALRMAQLVTLGYDFYSLFGAFVFSTSNSRDATLVNTDDDSSGSLRCDGCIMFQGKLEETLEAIVNDERIRAAKAALLWAESSGFSLSV